MANMLQLGLGEINSTEDGQKWGPTQHTYSVHTQNDHHFLKAQFDYIMYYDDYSTGV